MSTGLSFQHSLARQNCNVFLRLFYGYEANHLQVVTFGFDSFQTYIGPTAAQADKTKQCQLHLSLQYPGGFQYSVVDATYHGWARLDPGVTGTFISSYFFSQAASQTVRSLPPVKLYEFLKLKSSQASTRSTISGSQWTNGDIYTKHDSIQSTAREGGHHICAQRLMLDDRM